MQQIQKEVDLDEGLKMIQYWHLATQIRHDKLNNKILNNKINKKIN